MGGEFMRKTFAFVYLIVPSILVSAPYWINALNESLGMYLAFVYIITMIGIIIFFKFNNCGFYILPLGLSLSLLFPFVMAIWGLYISITQLDGYYAAVWQLNIVFLIACFIFYVLPFTLISLIIRKRRALFTNQCD